MHTLSQHIAQIREDYSLATLDEHLAGDDPLALFEKWFREADISEITDVNAMSLATVDASLQPHVRTVLLKGLEGGGFVFYTNYESTKGQDISFCNKVSLLFFLEGAAAPGKDRGGGGKSDGRPFRCLFPVPAVRQPHRRHSLSPEP